MVPRRLAPRRGRRGLTVGNRRPSVAPRHLAPQWRRRGGPLKNLPHSSPRWERHGKVATSQPVLEGKGVCNVEVLVEGESWEEEVKVNLLEDGQWVREVMVKGFGHWE